MVKSQESLHLYSLKLAKDFVGQSCVEIVWNATLTDRQSRGAFDGSSRGVRRFHVSGSRPVLVTTIIAQTRGINECAIRRLFITLKLIYQPGQGSSRVRRNSSRIGFRVIVDLSEKFNGRCHKNPL